MCAATENEMSRGGDRAASSTDRASYWRQRLGRLRLGAEPLAEQLERYRRATWVLTLVPVAIGLMIAAIFAAFRRPDIGLLLAAILAVPIATLAWLDFLRLQRAVAEYEAENGPLNPETKTEP
jgi:hypothetical protein